MKHNRIDAKFMNFMLGFVIEILGKCKLNVVLANSVRLNVGHWKTILEIEKKLSIKEMIRGDKKLGELAKLKFSCMLA